MAADDDGDELCLWSGSEISVSLPNRGSTQGSHFGDDAALLILCHGGSQGAAQDGDILTGQ